jgi:hypothetical protein
VSVYHTPRCRITSTNVHSDGVDTDVVGWNRPLTLFFDLEFDPALRGQAHTFYLGFVLESLGSGWTGGGYRSGPMYQLPGTTGRIWVSKTLTSVGTVVGFPAHLGHILYRPRVSFYLGDYEVEFAVAEEDHYIYASIPLD